MLVHEREELKTFPMERAMIHQQVLCSKVW